MGVFKEKRILVPIVVIDSGWELAYNKGMENDQIVVLCPYCSTGITVEELRRLWGSYCGRLQTPHRGPGRPKQKQAARIGRPTKKPLGVGLCCHNCGHVRKRGLSKTPRRDEHGEPIHRCGMCKTKYRPGVVEALQQEVEVRIESED
jgi:hypothetical protein